MVLPDTPSERSFFCIDNNIVEVNGFDWSMKDNARFKCFLSGSGLYNCTFCNDFRFARMFHASTYASWRLVHPVLLVILYCGSVISAWSNAGCLTAIWRERFRFNLVCHIFVDYSFVNHSSGCNGKRASVMVLLKCHDRGSFRIWKEFDNAGKTDRS